MIIPSIDIQNGNAVQLVGGKEKKIDAGCSLKKLEEFKLAGEVAVIDLDAAMRKGSNKEIIKKMCQLAPCRVGGGIRDLDTAIEWLDAGAAKIIIGTKAEPELLSQLPKERLIAALDAENGEIVVEGWQEKTGLKVLDRIHELKEYVSGFLVTFVELEGRMQGTNLEAVAELKKAAGDCELTIAGGITKKEEIAELDKLGCDSQVGMAIYSGNLKLSDCIDCVIPFKIFPSIILNKNYSPLEFRYLKDLEQIVNTKTLDNLSVKRILPNKQRTCFYITTESEESIKELANPIDSLEKTLISRKDNATQGSYTNRLLNDSDLLSSKLLEEAKELIDARDSNNAAWELADLIYFGMTALISKNGNLDEVKNELKKRDLKVSRRAGDKKE